MFLLHELHNYCTNMAVYWSSHQILGKTMNKCMSQNSKYYKFIWNHDFPKKKQSNILAIRHLLDWVPVTDTKTRDSKPGWLIKCTRLHLSSPHFSSSQHCCCVVFHHEPMIYLQLQISHCLLSGRCGYIISFNPKPNTHCLPRLSRNTRTLGSSIIPDPEPEVVMS